MNSRVWRIAPLLFTSGLCALVYQTAWQRELRLIFGASTLASAAVLAIFMAGLGVGGALLGPRADRHKRPLELYGNLELLIALSAALTPALVWVAREVYVALGGTVALGLAGGSVVRLVLSTLLLAVPTVLMGGTLPAVARAAETPDDVRRRALAVLYGINTLGAVAGATLSTFFLFEVFGTQQTLYLACLLNALVALIARVMARSMPELETASAEAQGTAPSTVAADSADASRPPRTYVLAAAATVGFAFFLMELVWYRMLSPLLGGTTFTFGIILVVALLGIGLGGAAYAAWSHERPASMRGFALTCLAEALLIAVPFALGDRVAAFAMMLRDMQGFGFIGMVLGWSAVTALVIFPAAFVSGVQFPVLLALMGRGRKDVGREVGQVYAWNTVGSIVGSLAGGFGVLPLLTAPGTWRLVAGLLLALGLVALVLSLRSEKRFAGALVPVGLAAFTAWLLTALGPTAAWRHSPIGVGRAGVDSPTTNTLHRWTQQPRSRLVWEAEGVETSVGLLANDGLAFYVSGKPDGNSIGDASTQVMSGLLGTLVHPQPRQMMVIGMGTGSTAGWVAKVEGVEKVDVVEIEPAILEVARRCEDVNHRVMDNPKVHNFVGDAREVLLASRQTYDIIFSEPSNPFRAGIANLFTRDFYRAARQRLAPGGLFLQWLQAYDIDAQTIRSAYATLLSEFGAVETWQTNGGDLILVASEAPISYDVAMMRARVNEPLYRQALNVAWHTDELEGALARFLGGAGLARKLAEGQEGLISTDDLSHMEFALARTVGRPDAFPLPGLRATAVAMKADRPAIRQGEVDWDRVETQRMLLYLHSRGRLITLPSTTAQSRSALQRKEFSQRAEQGDSAGAVRAWREAGWQPRGVLELTLVGRELAELKDEAGLQPLLEQLRAQNPLEAEVLAGYLRLRQGRGVEAAEALERAVALLRREPWGLRTMTTLMMASILELSEKDATLARRFYAALETPLSGFALEQQRRTALVELARAIDWPNLCGKALSASEPHPTWDRSTLLARAECYEQTRHPLRDKALADLEEFMAGEPAPMWEPDALPNSECPAPSMPVAGDGMTL